jgi:peptidyl-prolyl cis-trans isomerase B (cyclophilin B)
MMRSIRLLARVALSGVLFTVGLPAQESQAPPPNPRVVIETTEGDITVELFREDARVSVVNFLTYVQDGFYTGTIFHRVIRDFMIQGGGFTMDVAPKTEGLRGGILNEATNRLDNRRGTIAMARTGAPNSAQAQFFINTENNRSLNHRDTSQRGFGYAVFGRVVDGMDVVDTIERTRTHRVNGMDDVPREPVIIKQIRRLD